MIAGFVGTAVMSVLMLMKSMLGLVPDLDPIGLLAGMFGDVTALGWILHVLIGTIVWGGGFALIYNLLPTRNSVIKGIIFGILAWLAMMLFIMPMGGEGFFGLEIGIIAPIMTLMLHVIFGAVMGAVFGRRVTTDAVAA